MEKKRLTLTLAMLFCSLTLSNSALAEPEPTEPKPKEVNTEQTSNELDADENEQNQAQENAEVASSIVAVSPYEMYITDELFVFIHSGSSNRYRIIGRVAASEKVTIISKDQSTGWLEVQLNDKKTGWLDANMLVDNAGVKAKLATANEKIKQLNLRISKLGSVSTDDLSKLENQITELNATNTELTNKLMAKEQEAQDLRASIKQTDETKRILAKLYDVGAVVLGVFVGWLLTRRKKNQWV